MQKFVATGLCIGVLGIAAWAESPTRSSDMVIGQKKLKGCLVSQGGKFLLQERKGKLTLLSGSQDLGTQVGHTVMAYGAFSQSSPSSSSRSTARSTFLVSKLDPISDTCGSDRNKIAQQTFDSSGKPSPNHFR